MGRVVRVLAVATLVAIAAVAVSLSQLSSLRESEFELTELAMPYERLLATAALAAKSAANDERGYLLTHNDEFLKELRELRDPVVRTSLDKAVTLFPDNSIHTREVKAIREDYDTWARARDEAINDQSISQANAVQLSMGANRQLRKSYEQGFSRAIDLSRDSVNGSHQRFVHGLNMAQRITIAFSVSAVAGAIFLLLWVMRAMRSDHRKLAATAAAEATAHAFERQLTGALDMAETPEDVYGVVSQALPSLGHQASTELLLADSSEAHLSSAASNISGQGCPVTAMWSCPAIRRGRTQVTTNSAALDACPRLHQSAVCSAVCTPVMFMGKAMGVMHTRAAASHVWQAEELARIRLLGGEVGTRLGLLRAMAQTELQASTDSLTGMANRRTLEKEVRDLVRRGIPYTVVMGDLDSFKNINDTYGHDSGDRALRRFGRVLRQIVRKNDILARYGGDEFVMVLPEMPEQAAVTLLERVRTMLAEQDGDDHLPAFTASFGVSSSLNVDFKEALDAADRALLQAKRTGRNRIVRIADALLEESLPDHELHATA
jgi:diguanylate cyclase (GGDEF)-like protein